MTRVGTGFFTMSSFRDARCPLSRAEKSSLVLRAVKYQGTPSFPRTRWLPDEPPKAYHNRSKIFRHRILSAQLFCPTTCRFIPAHSRKPTYGTLQHLLFQQQLRRKETPTVTTLTTLKLSLLCRRTVF